MRLHYFPQEYTAKYSIAKNHSLFFTHSIIKYLLRICFELDTGDIIVNITNRSPCPHGLYKPDVFE